MTGTFELFTDRQSHFRFRLLATDGTVQALSQTFGDKDAAVAAITDVRECAGTGLIQDHYSAVAPLGAPQFRRLPTGAAAHGRLSVERFTEHQDRHGRLVDTERSIMAVNPPRPLEPTTPTTIL